MRGLTPYSTLKLLIFRRVIKLGKTKAQVLVWGEDLEVYPLWAIRQAYKWAIVDETRLPSLKFIHGEGGDPALRSLLHPCSRLKMAAFASAELSSPVLPV